MEGVFSRNVRNVIVSVDVDCENSTEILNRMYPISIVDLFRAVLLVADAKGERTMVEDDFLTGVATSLPRTHYSCTC